MNHSTNDVERAIAEIRDIRAQLAASTRFLGIAPKASASTGLLALVLAVAQTLRPDVLANDASRYVFVWVGFLIGSIVIVTVEAIARPRWRQGAMAVSILDSTLRLALPFVAAGIVITCVILRFAPEICWILPGLWQILVALIGFAVLPSLPKAIVWPACWYFVCGSIVLALAASNVTLSPWMMGLPFAIGQPVVALILYLNNGEHDAGA